MLTQPCSRNLARGTLREPEGKSRIKNEFLQKGKKIIDRIDDMKNIASNRLEDWLEEDEDINQNLDFKQQSFYNNDRKSRSFSDKKEDDPWI